jgi:hypothetical protein
MRVESSVTSVSWIPSEAIAGMTRLPFDLHLTHYDDPPPDHLDDLDELHRRGAFRFANELRAWADVEDGRIVRVGHEGRDLLSRTLVRLGPTSIAFSPTAFPILRDEPDWGSEWATFTQTAGGRPGVPAPRVVRGAPFVKLEGPNVWTTLSLTLRPDGTSSWSLVGASPFPRHWIYDSSGALVAKAGVIDFKDWYAGAFGEHSPWGGEQAAAVTTEAETPLERSLATTIMRSGRRPPVRRLAAGEVLVEEGAPGTSVFLVLDGVLTVTVDGSDVAQLGPGAVVGERALFEGGRRTATLTAASPCKVVEAAEADLDPAALRELTAGHRREER